MPGKKTKVLLKTFSDVNKLSFSLTCTTVSLASRAQCAPVVKFVFHSFALAVLQATAQYIGMCGPKGYGFSVQFKLISAILVINRVWFLHSNLDMGIYLRRRHFFIIIEKKINKSPSQIMFTVI